MVPFDLENHTYERHAKGPIYIIHCFTFVLFNLKTKHIKETLS